MIIIINNEIDFGLDLASILTMAPGFGISAILLAAYCYEPPVSEKSDIQKLQEDVAKVTTPSPLGTISMAISGVDMNEDAKKSTAQVELGLVQVAEFGDIVPKRIEFTPFVYNKVESTDATQVNLEKDQGAGLKMTMKNVASQWDVILKGTISTAALDETSRQEATDSIGVFSITLSKSFGGTDPEKHARLDRLRNLTTPMIVYVSDQDFDSTLSRSSQAIRLIHRRIMTTYLTAAVENWYKKNAANKDAEAILKSHFRSAVTLHRWLRDQLVTEKQLYIRSVSNREIYVRPGEFKDQRWTDQPKLFDPNEMLYEFVMSLDYPDIKTKTTITASPENQ